MNVLTATLLKKEMLTEDTGILKFKTDEKAHFKQGQFYNIKVEQGMRPYSVSSKESDDYLEFYVKADLEEGRVAKHILALEIGDEATLKGPFGNHFVLQETDRNIYFICAGSGVAPMIGMARHLKELESVKTITFLHGTSYVEQFGYLEELKGMENEYFRYIPTISRPEENKDWSGMTGRVENHLEFCTDCESEVYICGPPPMVTKVEEELLKKGFPKENIFVERYY